MSDRESPQPRHPHDARDVVGKGWRIGLTLGAIALFAGLNLLAPATRVDWVAVVVLAGLALAAELRPIHFQREGILLAFSVPFLMGAVWAGGPVVVVGTEILVLAAAHGIRSFQKKDPRALYWFGLNLPVVIICSSLSGGVWAILRSTPLHWSVALSAAIAVYLVANLVLVSRINSKMGAQTFSHQVINGAKTVAFLFAAYVLVATGVAILVREDLVALVPLMMIPIELLRRLVVEYKRADDHAYETMVALTIMLQRAHPYTHGHLERVGRLAEEVGRRLGLPASQSRLLREAAVLHDIGKIAIDEEVLDKPAKLTDTEYEHVKLHAEFGAQILSHAERFHAIVPWIRHHHERPDGRGYPHQLTDVEIPIESKIISVSDAYDAMVGGASSSEKRNHREPMTPRAAIEELERCSGTQFDPAVVAAFKSALQGGKAP